MSSKGAPSPDTKSLGLDKSRFSTAEQARPIPWFVGNRPVGVTFISRLFDTRVGDVEEEVGKSDTVTGRKYWASFLVLIGYGVLTRVNAIRLNDDVVWDAAEDDVDEGFFNGADSKTLQLPRHGGTLQDGKVYLYAGTETQPLDPYVHEFMLTRGKPLHPAYRGFAYAVFRRLYLGLNQQNVQTIEIDCDRIPQIGWTTHEQIFTSPTNDPSRANIIAGLADLLQNQRAGLGLSDEWLNTAALDAAALQLKTEKVGVAASYDRAQELRSIAADLLQYADGYPLLGGDGRLSVGLVRKPADIDALPIVTETHFARRPEIVMGDWSQIATSTDVRYMDPDLDPKNNPKHAVETTAKWRDRGAYRITGEPNAISAQRTFSMDGDLYAAAIGRANALPAISGSLALRRTGTLFDDLGPGAQFRLQYPARNLADLVCRVTERTEARAGAREFDVSFKVDRSYLTPSSNATAKSLSEEDPKPDGDPPVPVESVRVIELPLALCPEGKLSLAMLVARPSANTSGYSLHIKRDYDWDLDPPDSFALLATSSQFAQHGLLEENYDADLLDESEGLLISFAGPDTTLGESTAWDAVSDNLLVFVEDEILSVHRVELVGTDTYRLYCLRARFSTTKVAHVAGAEVYVMPRAKLEPLQHPRFELGNAFAFKVAPVAGSTMLDLAEADEITGTIAGRIHAEPILAALSSNGQTSAATYSTGQDIAVAWTLTDPNADYWQDSKRLVNIILEVWNSGFGAVVHTFTLGGMAEAQAITNAELQSYLGGEVSFALRLRRRTTLPAGVVESASIELAVTKV